MFKPKVKPINKFLKFFLGKYVIGITLAPFGIYLSEKYLTNTKTINHEKIHWKQQLEMLIIPFYLWYFIEWIIKLFTISGSGGESAYRSLSFEREAYDNADNLNYIETRKPYSWFKYITKQ